MFRMVSLKVDGLSHRTNTDDLEALFEKYGRIGDVYIPKVSLRWVLHMYNENVAQQADCCPNF
jgi:hypothetical protein